MWFNSIKAMTLTLLLLATLAGCQRGETMGKVQGQVTLDGKAVSQGLVVFSNSDQGIHIVANLQSDGTYELQMAQGYGLPLGTYQVAVSPPLPTPAMPGMPEPPSAGVGLTIPARYSQLETSGLVATIVEGDNTFDVAMHSR